MADPGILLRGAEVRGPEWVLLRAGPLAMHFDPETLAVRRIRLGNREVLRSIYAAVRDCNWGTVTPQVSDLRIEQGDGAFRLSFEARCTEDAVDFAWRGLIAGERDGTVRFRFDGEARATFLRARIGICVLHPLAECAGQPCAVEHVDGSIEQAAFPARVAPWQPFKQVRALTHEIMPGLKAEVRFEGDTFETEDQRNWTDASFKTYSTPLELPYPVEVARGTKVRQEVRLLLHGPAPATVESRENALAVAPLLNRAVALPPLGLGFARHAAPLTARDLERLRRLRLSHLRVDLRCSSPTWRDDLRNAAWEATQIAAGLHVALHLGESPERDLDAIAAEAAATQAPVSLWMVFRRGEKATAPKWIDLARTKLERIRPGVPLAAGTDAFFAELNRERLGPDSGALPCYSINPQVHASDLASMAENLDGQADTVETAFQFARQPVVVSPVTLRPRFNPNAAAPNVSPTAERPLADADPRRSSLFGAAWTLGSIARLACTGRVHSLTYYETVGPSGIVQSEAQPPGRVFPMFHVFAAVAGWSQVCPLDLPNSLSAAGLILLGSRGNARILVGSLVERTQRVRLSIPAARACFRILDGSSVELASRDPEGFWAKPGQWHQSDRGVVEVQVPAFAVGCWDFELA